ncbi:unnamed protein product [Amoebophrya sp. A120]|nr:unnamed protein product [Amoebophrya sp. A120]|eukprot:GSA120T00010297001.1
MMFYNERLSSGNMDFPHEQADEFHREPVDDRTHFYHDEDNFYHKDGENFEDYYLHATDEVELQDMVMDNNYYDVAAEDNTYKSTQGARGELPRAENPEEDDDDHEQDTAGALIRYNNVARDLLQQMRVNSNKLKTLDLSGMLFSNAFYKEFANQRKHNTNLTALYLNNCNLTDNNLRQIVLGELTGDPSKQLEVLSCENNFLKNVSCFYIARALCGFATIKNKVTSGASRALLAGASTTQTKWSRSHGGRNALDIGGSNVANRLRYLSLRKNLINGSDGIRILADALMNVDKNLEVLNLSENLIDNYGLGWMGMVLRNNNVLKMVDLRGNRNEGNDGIHEILLACEASDCNLVYADYAVDTGEHLQESDNVAPSGDMAVACLGKRNCTVYTDHPFGRPSARLARQASSPEKFFKSPKSKSRAPVLRFKRSSTRQNEFEPASIMSERVASDNQFRATSSSMLENNFPDFQHWGKLFQQNGELESGMKETSLGYGISRLRFKPGVETRPRSSSSPTRRPRSASAVSGARPGGILRR